MQIHSDLVVSGLRVTGRSCAPQIRPTVPVLVRSRKGAEWTRALVSAANTSSGVRGRITIAVVLRAGGRHGTGPAQHGRHSRRGGG